MVSLLEQYIIQLDQLGVTEVLLPFLLIFTIAFAVLQKSKILGEKSHKFNVILSLVLALVVIIPHITNPDSGVDAVDIINKALPNVSLLMIASMMVLLLIGVFGSNVNVAGTSLAGIVVIFAIIAVGYTFLASAGVVDQIGFLQDDQTRSLVVAILVFGIIVWFITSEPDEESEGLKGIFESLGKVFERGPR